MKTKLYSIVITVLALTLLFLGNFDFARGELQSASAADGVSYVNVPAAAFLPSNDSIDYIFGDTGFYLEKDSTTGQFYAPVYLPHGATLSKLTLYRYDTYDGFLPYCYLRTIHSNTFASTVIAMVATDDPTYNGWNSISTTEFSVPVVDNSQYFYTLQCYMGRETLTSISILVGLRIEYSYPVYLPLTRK